VSKQAQLLLLEDDNFDVVVLQRSMATAKIKFEVHLATDGEEALEKLGLLGEQSFDIHPEIVVLDINVPRISGLEVCRKIRQTPKYKNLHVVFFSGSRSEQDKAQAFIAGANAYFDKNEGPRALMQHIQQL